ncbi:MAG TPA: MBOAT family O-acyltransferase [Caulobacteraceae bacterium]
MDVPSIQFLGFAAAGAVAYNLSGAKWWRMAVLLVCNLAFLASFTHQAGAFIPYAGFVLLGYGFVFAIQNGAPKQLRVVAILAMLGLFFWLKKYSFLPSVTYLTFPYMAVGLSYVFFRVLHLIIDAHDSETIGRVGPFSYLNYTLNFTSIVSGPIQRYEDYERMTGDEPALLDLVAVGVALERIVAGLFKVMVVSHLLSMAQHALLARVLGPETMLEHIRDGALLIALYPIYLFFNFSGYVDFVIGVARFFRIQLPENFDRPFSSASFIEYWSRWHMTLSNWLKTYVYNPLLMVLMRRVRSKAVGPYLAAFALFVTFFLIGAWHGRTAEFLFFGVLNGAGVGLNQAYRTFMSARMGRKPFAALGRNRVYQALCRGLTFSWLAFTLLWFWSDWGQLGQIARALGPLGMAGAGLVVFATATVVLEAMVSGRKALLSLGSADAPLLTSRYLRTAWATALVVFVLAFQVVMDSPAPDIVYKAF